MEEKCSALAPKLINEVIEEYLKVREFDFGRELKRVHILNNKQKT